MAKGSYNGGSTIVGPGGWGTFDPAEVKDSRLSVRKSPKSSALQTAPGGPMTEAFRTMKTERKVAARAQRDAEAAARKAQKAKDAELKSSANEAGQSVYQKSNLATEQKAAGVAKKKEVKAKRKAALAAERAASKTAAAKVVVERRNIRAKGARTIQQRCAKQLVEDFSGPFITSSATGILNIDGADYRIVKVVRRVALQDEGSIGFNHSSTKDKCD